MWNNKVDIFSYCYFYSGIFLYTPSKLYDKNRLYGSWTSYTFPWKIPHPHNSNSNRIKFPPLSTIFSCHTLLLTVNYSFYSIFTIIEVHFDLLPYVVFSNFIRIFSPCSLQLYAFQMSFPYILAFIWAKLNIIETMSTSNQAHRPLNALEG